VQFSCNFSRLLALILNVEQGDSRWLTVIQFTIGRSNHDPNQSEVNQVPLMLSTNVHNGLIHLYTGRRAFFLQWNKKLKLLIEATKVSRGGEGVSEVGGGDEGQRRWRRGRQRSVEVTKVSEGGEGVGEGWWR
jgi:hypothetical protein